MKNQFVMSEGFYNIISAWGVGAECLLNAQLLRYQFQPIGEEVIWRFVTISKASWPQNDIIIVDVSGGKTRQIEMERRKVIKDGNNGREIGSQMDSKLTTTGYQIKNVINV